MAFYSVLEVTPTSNDWGADYLEPANNAMARHGGKYLARTIHHERVEGINSEEPTLRIIIEWPKRDAAIDFLNDPEYVPHLKARTKGSISHHFLIEGKDDFSLS